MNPLIKILALASVLVPFATARAQDTDFRQAAREAMARYEYSKAIEFLDQASEGVEDVATLRDIALQKARCQKKLLRFDAASETLASVMGPGMLDVEVAGELADCHVNSGKLGDALILYSLLSMQHPDNLYLSIQKASLLFKVGDFEGCLDEGKAICDKEPIPSIYSLIGASALKLGQVDSSLVYYRKSLELNPLNAGTVTSISNILLGKKDYDGIISMAKDFIEKVPDNLGIGQILGVAYYLKDDQDEAYEVFKQLRKDGDDSYGTMYYSGLNALSLNRFQVARDCFDSAWQTDSTDAKLAVNYATALVNGPITYKKDDVVHITPKEAEYLYNKALELSEPDPGVMYKTHKGLGQLYYQGMQDMNKALPHYEAAYKYNPDDISLLVSIGYCHEVRKEYKQALQYYEKYMKVGKEGTKNFDFAKQSSINCRAELHMQE
ncbi:MAG: tetratricopeptide repeat protein [Bacteroidales bacterium]|nr:tetratricopeptide repeat protein [Bacteroidales bacterium]